MSMQSMLKELRTLKQEEMTMINLASKISDQLNRLKVEELALQNLVRLQSEEQNRQVCISDRSRLSSNPTGEVLQQMSDVESDDQVELDLNVTSQQRALDWQEQEEEEEEEGEDSKNKICKVPNDIEEFVQQLS